MSEPFELEADEAVLCQEECLQRRGPLAYEGKLIVTDRRVFFEASRLSRLTGAKAFQLKIEDITSVALVGIARLLVIKAGVETARFMGPGARRVHARLNSQLLQIRSPDSMFGVEARSLFEEGEKVVFQGTLERYLNPVLSASGDVTLTDRRFRFTPLSTLDRLLFDGAPVDLPLDEIKSSKMVGVRHRLELKTHDRRLLFGGSNAGRVYALLGGVMYVEEEGSSAESATQGALATWEVSLHRGPIAHKGTLVVGSQRLRFATSGMLDALVGAHDVDLALADVERIALRGVADRRLVLRADGQDYLLSMAQVSERFQDFIELLLRTDGSDDPEVLETGEVGDGDLVAKLLGSWVNHLGRITESRVAMFGPAVHLGGKGTFARRGWMCLTQRRILFLPAGGPDGREDLLAVPTQGVKVPMDSDDQHESLDLKGKGFNISLLLRGGQPLVDEFWARVSEGRWTRQAGRAKQLAAQDVSKQADEAEAKFSQRRGQLNRRESFRIFVPVEIQARVELDPEPGRKVAPIFCRVMDVSLGGMGVVTSWQLNLSQEGWLEVTLKDSKLRVRVSVRYSRQVGRTWHNGLMFEVLRYTEETIINEAYMHFQSEVLSQRSKS